MKGSTILVGVAFVVAMSTASLAQVSPGAGQVAEPEIEATSNGEAPGQAAGGAASEGVAGGPGAGFVTTRTYRSHSIAAGASAGNLEGKACPSGYKMLSGACHPFYNDRVVIINQFPNISANTWRCGFKNNTGSTRTVYIYTLCGK